MDDGVPLKKERLKQVVDLSEGIREIDHLAFGTMLTNTDDVPEAVEQLTKDAIRKFALLGCAYYQVSKMLNPVISQELETHLRRN